MFEFDSGESRKCLKEELIVQYMCGRVVQTIGLLHDSFSISMASGVSGSE